MSRSRFLFALVTVIFVAIIIGVQPSLSLAQASDGTGMPAMVLVVRHAEKSTEPANDPALTKAGAERAQALAEALSDAGVTAIITTQLRRTSETAQPLAALRGLTPEVVPVQRGQEEEHIKAVVAAARKHEGGIVLIVGHSNTVSAIIAALGGPCMPNISESIYDNLFILVPGTGNMRLVRSHFGAASQELKQDSK